MLEMIAVLLVLQLIGEATVALFNLPLPGPVLGMVLLFILLVIRGRSPDALNQVTRGLLENLSLMFVPAGVGIMTHLSMLDKQWLPLSIALILSTLITLGVTGWTMQWLVSRKDRADEEHHHE